ncbi:MAG TPA: DUF1727 domain-containing protein [Clostridiaceae bacterium]|nr:DUF1727 domain-containing protein [Clostridiaceae bacterium]
MNLRLLIAVSIAKIITILLKAVKRSATTLPGKIALKVYPQIISVLAKNFKLIMVTGTNGKTTTVRIVGRILEESSIKYITNKSGANLSSGIATTFINAVTLTGKSNASTALLEVDEAALISLSKFIEPDILIVTNFFRDQLDRYGELYTTLNGIRGFISGHSGTTLILNADDSLCASLGNNVINKVVYYGIEQETDANMNDTDSDAVYCIYCREKYKYRYHTYGHLGGFYCESCGYSRPMTQVKCISIDYTDSSHSQIKLTFENKNKDKDLPEIQVLNGRINLPGLYNIYNALAAAACGYALGLPSLSIMNALAGFEPGFGRMETIKTNKRNINIILVKNPVGFNQVINFLISEENDKDIMILINDGLADGTDISWLWDVDFEKFKSTEDRINNIFVSGTRGRDMAVRLKYAGFSTHKIHVVDDYDYLIDKCINNLDTDRDLYILPNYTAMLEIRKLLAQKFKLKEF